MTLVKQNRIRKILKFWPILGITKCKPKYATFYNATQFLTFRNAWTWTQHILVCSAFLYKAKLMQGPFTCLIIFQSIAKHHVQVCRCSAGPSGFCISSGKYILIIECTTVTKAPQTIVQLLFCWTKVHFVEPLLTPILDFMWPSLWVSKVGWFSCLLSYLLVYSQPNDHVWWYTCLFHQ